MKNKSIIIVGIVLLFMIIQTISAEQYSINQLFTKDTTLTIFKKTKTISSIKMNAFIKLNGENSLIRVILVNANKDENLIYETYYQIAESEAFSVNLSFDETEFLDNVSPSYIKIHIDNASIDIKSFTTTNNLDALKLASINAERINSIKKKNVEKINKLNNVLKKSNMKWRAGETELSNMTYKEKKAYFGLENYNSHGLEYYIGGIFEFKDYENHTKNNVVSKVKSSVASIVSSPYIENFDWREKHGANNPLSPYYTGNIDGWISPIKRQWSGTCWAYSAVGVTETLVNLYFNKPLDLDLAEHDVASCSGGGNIEHPEWGGSVTTALNYIKNTGVVNESCFPNPTDEIQLPCVNKCSSPAERIQFGSYSNYEFTNEDELKNLVIKSPMTFAICCSYICHATVVVGYRIIKEGDIVWHSLTNTNEYISIEAGDPLIGRICWIIKNSGGTTSPNSPYGYTYYVIDNFTYISQHSTCSVTGPISSLQYNSNDIKCVDIDGDGYYNWGVGPKPATCPVCVPDDEDGDDSNPNLGPMDSYGFCQTLTAPISYPDITISSNTTWNTKNMLCGNLVITNGATLTISDKLIMPINSTITLSGNSKLVVDGGTITYANIVVENGSELTLQNNAVLQLYKNDELNINIGAVFNNNYGDIQILSSYWSNN